MKVPKGLSKSDPARKESESAILCWPFVRLGCLPYLHQNNYKKWKYSKKDLFIVNNGDKTQNREGKSAFLCHPETESESAKTRFLSQVKVTKLKSQKVKVSKQECCKVKVIKL